MIHWPIRVWVKNQSTGLWTSHEPQSWDIARRREFEDHYRETGKFPKAYA